MSKVGDRITDWSAGGLTITPPESPLLRKGLPPGPSASVVYEADRVLAYFNALGQSVAPHFATWAKVWTKDDLGGLQMQMVSLTEQP